MKFNKHKTFIETSAFLTACLVLCLTGYGWSAGTNVNQLIQNQATATYVDANNNTHTAQSNLATITVGQVFSATLTQDHTLTGVSGQQVYFSETLVNTGNGRDTYTISLAETVTGQDDVAFQTMSVYYDKNNNGTVDDGETLIAVSGGSGTITLAPDERVSLVIQSKIPDGASVNQVLGGTISVVPTSGTVDDLTTGNGLDGNEGTNEFKVTVTSDAVLIMTKSSTYNHQMTYNNSKDDTVTFTITLKNTGQSPAYNIELYDVVDLTKFAVSSISDITVISTNGDFVDGVSTDEGAIGTETIQGFSPIATNNVYNQVGVTNVFGVRGHDDVLPPNTTVSFTFLVRVLSTLTANTPLSNTAKAVADTNNDGDKTDSGEDILSNVTTQLVMTSYSVVISDIGSGQNFGVNDGGDDDNTVNDNQLVDRVASGEIILYKHTIKNTGNGNDTFELSVPATGAVGNDFPPGTVFSFWNATGNTALLDTNNDGKIDTGSLSPDETFTILVKVQLPSGAYDNDGTNVPDYSTTLVATSSGSKTVSDSSTETLYNISKPNVDLSNAPSRGIDSSDGNPLVNKDAYSVGGTTPITTFQRATGSNVVYAFTIENDSGVPDAFQLSLGGSWNGTVLGPLPNGFDYVFHDEPDNVITTTPAIPAHAKFLFHVHIVVPSDPILTRANYTSDIDSNGTIDVVDGNGDNDGDYPLIIRVKSVNTGSWDITLDALDIADQESITVVPNQTGQIQPGGSVSYQHNLRNDGNTVETLTLSGVNSLISNGWGNSILVDTTGAGVPNKPFNALTGTDKVYYYNSSSVYVSQVFGGSGIPSSSDKIRLNPGEQLPLIALVFSPSSAPDGTLDVLTVKATYNTGTTIAKAIDQTTVILGQLRLTKTSAVDANCDCAPDVSLATVATSNVKPNECIAWQVVVTNAGTAAVSKVKIFDAVPMFTTFLAGSLRSGVGNAGTSPSPAVTLSVNTDSKDDESAAHPLGYHGHVSNNEIEFHIGTGATQTEGGSIAPGQTISMRFCTRVE